MHSMASYTKAAMQRATKLQEVILRAMAKKITWWQAAEIIDISDRHMRRWRELYEEAGFRGLFDRWRGKPCPSGTDLPIYRRENKDVTLCETKLVLRYN
jgi:helix-turn-helix protein